MWLLHTEREKSAFPRDVGGSASGIGFDPKEKSGGASMPPDPVPKLRRTLQGFFFAGGFFSPPLVLISAKKSLALNG